jgi:predicted small secreted protein
MASGFLAMMLLALASAALGACNTVHGFGQDVQDLSDTVRKSF